MMNDLALLVARVTLGASIASHGAQKAFGWFEGPGPQNAGAYFETLGFKPGAQYAAAASYNEIAAGALIALGAGGPLGPAGVLATMLVAAQSVHAKNGFFAAKGGIELNVVYSAAALALASTGYGAISLDRALRLDEKLRHPILTTLAIAGGLAAAWTILAQRDFSPPAGTLATPTIAGNGASPSPAPAAN